MEYDWHPVTTGRHGFCDDVAIMPHTQHQPQEKVNIVAKHLARLELNIHKGKSKILKVNSTSDCRAFIIIIKDKDMMMTLNHGTVSVTLGVEAIEEVDHFAYLGSIVDTQAGTWACTEARIGKARVAFLQLRNMSSDIQIIQRPFAQKQDQDFQYKRQGRSSLRSRDMDDYSDHHKEDEDTDVQ